MRIIAGDWRGRPIEAPPGQATRPTADRVREDLVLHARQPSRHRSRTCASPTCLPAAAPWASRPCRAARRTATFVETDAKAQRRSRRNAEKLGAGIGAGPRRLGAGLPRSEPFDLIFADPPYAAGSGSAVVEAVAKAELARARRLDERGDRARRRSRSWQLGSRRPATSAARGLRFCAGLSRSPPSGSRRSRC